jgi:uncharacterized lipoprotein YajG
LSLDAEQAQPPSGRRAGTRALAAIAVSAAALALAACSAPASSPGFSPADTGTSDAYLPPATLFIVTLSTAQIAKIKG